MDKFSELKAAALAATPGPWELVYDDWSDGEDALISCESRAGMVAIAKIEGGGSDSGYDEPFSSEQQANAAFIAAANPAVILALLAELEASDEKISARRQEVLRSLTERAETAEQKLAANNSEWFQLFPMASPRVVAMMNVDLQNAVAKRDQRIAELERANQSQDDHISQQQDRIDSLEKTNSDLGRGLAAAEKRLATPVQLQNCDFESVAIMAHWCTDEQLEAWVKGVEHAKKQIRAAGFTVEGDEQ